MAGFKTFHNPIHSPWWWGTSAPASDIVPWLLPVAINSHPYMIDFDKSRITTMQVRRVSSDDSVEPGEQTLSAAGIWPRAQDNYFLGIGQEFLDNRFAFESVYVHSGEYPSVRTRGWKSQGVNLWSQGKMSLLDEYASIATSASNLLIVACGNYLYKTDGAVVSFTNLEPESPTTWNLGGTEGNELTANQSSLESGVTTGYAAGSGTGLAASTVWAQDGSYSLQLQLTASTGQAQASTPTGESGVACVAGEPVRAMASFHSPAIVRACQVAISFYDATGTLISTATSPDVNSTLSGTGRQAFVTATAPTGAEFMSLTLLVTGMVHLEFIYADCMLLGPVETIPSWTAVTSANTADVVSITSDGSRVWFACGTDGVYVTSAATTSSATAATPAGLPGVGGVIIAAAAAGTVGAYMPTGSTNYYVTEVDSFGNETAPVEVTITVGTNPININWNPDTNASNFNVYRGNTTLIYTGDVPSFVDDGTVEGTTQAIPTGNETGATPYEATFILYAKGHLVASTGPDLVEILANQNITFIFQHENPNFVFNCGTELPSAIIVGGNSGGPDSGLAFIGALQPDTTNNGATLAPPTWATALPYGEMIFAIAYNAGSILLGTSLGVRTGTDANSNGIFEINPVIEDPGAVYCTAAWAQYQYFGWSNYDPSEPWAIERPSISGIGRADLSQYTTPGVPAYATDVLSSTIGTTTQVVVMGGVPYFVVNNEGDYSLWGPDGNVVASAWFEPGWIRYGTLENKIVVEVDFQHRPLPAGASVGYQIVAEDEATITEVGVNSVDGSTTVDTPLSAGLIVGDRFMPIITLTAATGQASGPTVLSHITKAMVTTKRQDEILLALEWADRVYSLGKSQKRWVFDCLAEYLYLKSLEGTGQVVTVTLLGITYSAYIDQVMLAPHDVNDMRTWFTGTTTVKIVTL